VGGTGGGPEERRVLRKGEGKVLDPSTGDFGGRWKERNILVHRKESFKLWGMMGDVCRVLSKNNAVQVDGCDRHRERPVPQF